VNSAGLKRLAGFDSESVWEQSITRVPGFVADGFARAWFTPRCQWRLFTLTVRAVLPEFRRPMEWGNRQTTVIDASELTAVIPATDVVLAASAQVRVETSLSCSGNNVSGASDSETGIEGRASSGGGLTVVDLGGGHFT